MRDRLGWLAGVQARRSTVVGVALGMAWLLSACHGGPHVFVVTTFADGSDANPGDDICEMTLGFGDCSLRAAIDEANASTGTPIDIIVPSGTYTLTQVGVDDTNAAGDLDLSPAGIVTLIADAPGASIDAAGNVSALDVHSATATIRKIGVTGASGAGVVVRAGATLGAESASIHDNAGPGVEVEATAAFNVLHATISTNGAGGVDNAGAVQAGYATITNNTGGGIAGVGTAALWMTIIADQATGPDCANPATSNDYNLDSDDTCGLDQPNDAPGVTPQLDALSTDLVPSHMPRAGPAVEAIPPTPGFCGDGFAGWDQTQTARPLATNCDIGAVEATHLDLIVNHGGDAPDALAGDGRCHDIGGAPGTCSLRAAIQETDAFEGVSQDSILVDLSVSTITIVIPGDGEDATQSGDLDVRGSVAIDGQGATVDGAGLDRVFDVQVGAVLDLTDLVITGGFGNGIDGAGIRVQGSGDLTRVTLIGNNAGSGVGGGFYSSGILTIEDSSITGNNASEGGGGAADSVPLGPTGQATIDRTAIFGNTGPEGGGVYGGTDSVLTISASSITGNSGTYLGAGIRSRDTLIIDNSTVSDNTGGPESINAKSLTVTSSTIRSTLPVGIRADGAWFASSIVTNAGGPACDIQSAGTSGYNISSDASCGFDDGTDLPDTNPVLGPLQDNGGPTPTRLPALASPAVDAIPLAEALCADTDQRLVPRPQGAGCDIGATEGVGPPIAPLSLTIDSALDLPDATAGDGLCDTGGGMCTLRAAIDETNEWAATDTIWIDPSVPVITMTMAGADEDLNATGDLDIRDHLLIEGQGATVDAAGVDRVFHAMGGGLTMRDLTVTGGDPGATSPGGGILNAAGPLTIENGAILNNTAGYGGGINSPDFTSLTISDAVVGGNTAFSGGGIEVTGADAMVSIVRTTFTGNSSTSGASGAAIDANSATLTIRESLFTANDAAGASGSVVFADRTTLMLANSTMADNAAVAGLYTWWSGTASVTDTTMREAGRALWNGGVPVSVTVERSIFFSSGTTACVGPISSAGYNLDSDNTCGLGQPTDLPGADPLLGALTDNGGPTWTVLPLGGSPVRDAIASGTPTHCDGTISTDQRGIVRPQSGACDIGATEQ